MRILGLHHITLVCADAQRTVDFYTQVLGLRLIKQTVDFDESDVPHLYFGDGAGQPGSVVTFFPWPDKPHGRRGIGGTHHFALEVADYDALLQWKRRLTDLGVPAIEGPLDRHYFTSVYFEDPDGIIIELATRGPGWTVDEAPDRIGTEQRDPPADRVIRNRDEARIAATTWPEPVPEITPGMALRYGLHHITAIAADIARTDALFGGVLGMRRVKMTSNFDDPTSAHWYWGAGDGRPGTLVTCFERDPAREPGAIVGPGQTHHFALAVADQAALRACREALLGAGLAVTEVRDRVYFKSIYFDDPDGHLIELATAGPGFAVDEPPDALGQSLKLPPWLEPRRTAITQELRPLHVPAWSGPSGDPVKTATAEAAEGIRP